jgi:hypothetical protein
MTETGGSLQVICAGFPKTGTKSLYEALKKLGYNHFEVPEVCSFILDDWVKEWISICEKLI